MPSKKKKYNARFPAGRIKKIMQSDEEIGKVAQAVPVIISRTLELFVESLLKKTLRITSSRNAKTISTSHMKQCIMSEPRFDFLRELVKNIPDISVAEEAAIYNDDDSSPEENYPDSDTPYDLSMPSTSASTMRRSSVATVNGGNDRSFLPYFQNGRPVSRNSHEERHLRKTSLSEYMYMHSASVGAGDGVGGAGAGDGSGQHMKLTRSESTPAANAIQSSWLQMVQEQKHQQQQRLLHQQHHTQHHRLKHQSQSVPCSSSGSGSGSGTSSRNHDGPATAAAADNNNSSNSNSNSSNSSCSINAGGNGDTNNKAQQQLCSPPKRRKFDNPQPPALQTAIPAPIVSFDFCNKPVVKIDYSNLPLTPTATAAETTTTAPHSAPTLTSVHASSPFDFNTDQPIINIDLSNIVPTHATQTHTSTTTNVPPMATISIGTIPASTQPPSKLSSSSSTATSTATATSSLASLSSLSSTTTASLSNKSNSPTTTTSMSTSTSTATIATVSISDNSKATMAAPLNSNYPKKPLITPSTATAAATTKACAHANKSSLLELDEDYDNI